MSSLERLPPDQRAVLALVLQRGRSYDDIAGLLAIDRAAVRDRALAALDALGPGESQVPAAQRALITDYLLGQLPARVRDEVRSRLGTSPAERAWARVVAGELSSLAAGPLPEIPSPQAARAPEPQRAPEPAPEPESEPEREPEPEPAVPPLAAAAPAPRPAQAPAQSTRSRPVPPPAPAGRPADRRTGTILLLLAVLIAAVVVIVVVATSGSDKTNKGAHHPSTATTPPAGTTSTTTSTTAATPKVVARFILRPVDRSSKAIGAAEVVVESNVTGVVVAAQHLPPNTKHNAYAVWLTAPGGASHLLGYVNPGVGKSGNLSTTGPLPSDAATYKDLLITIETAAGTKTPGPAVLEGALSLGAG